MPNPGPADYNLRDYYLTLFLQSIGASPVPAYVPVPVDGLLVFSEVTEYGVITTTDCTITVAVLPAGVAGSAVTVGGTIVVPVAGAAAGRFTKTTHTGANRWVRAGDVIRMTPAGSAGANIAANAAVMIRR